MPGYELEKPSALLKHEFFMSLTDKIRKIYNIYFVKIEKVA